MNYKTLLLAGVATCFAFSASAGGISPYVGAKFGAALQKADFKGEYGKKFDETKMFGSAAAGLAFKLSAGAIRTELEYTYRQEIEGKYAADGKAKEKTQSLFLNVYYDLPVKWVVVPYVGAGIGYSKAQLKDVDVNEWGKSKKIVGWNVGAGLAYNITKNFAIDAGYRYVDIGKWKNEGVRADLTNHEFYAGLRYTF